MNFSQDVSVLLVSCEQFLQVFTRVQVGQPILQRPLVSTSEHGPAHFAAAVFHPLAGDLPTPPPPADPAPCRSKKRRGAVARSVRRGTEPFRAAA